MKKPLVSVITPIYNGGSYLDYAVKSVLNQTYQNWELFLIDDGSKDDSYEKAVKWSEKDEKIKVLYHPDHINKGVSATRNLGISHAKGEYIALLDCDDEWLPEKLNKQIRVMLQYPETVMVYCLAEKIDEKGLSVKVNSQTLEGRGLTGSPFNVFEQMLDVRGVYPPCPTVLASTEYIKKCGGFDETLKYQIEDSLLFTLLSEHGPFFFIDEVLARYRFHSNSWSAKLDSHKTAMEHLQYFDRLFKSVKPEYYSVCSKELINRWSRYVITPVYWHPKTADISHILSTFFWILQHISVRLKDKLRCCQILIRWVSWRLFIAPFIRV